MIGSWLCRELVDAGANVSLLLPEIDGRSELFLSGVADRTVVTIGRLEDYSAVERMVAIHEPEVIFHLGAQTLVEAALRAPVATFEANIRGTYHVLEAARRMSEAVRGVVVASSDKAYGDRGGEPYTESMPMLPGSPYETSKACADLIAQSYFAAYGTNLAIARLGNVFGGGDLNWSRLVPGTMRALLLGETPELRSDGTYVREFLYVKDAVDAYLTLGARIDEDEVKGRAFNFSTGIGITVIEAFEAVCRAVGRKTEPRILDRARDEIHDQRLDSSRAAHALGWKPAYELEPALVETASWYRDFFGVTA